MCGEITKVMVNGKTTSPPAFKKIIAAMSNEQILREKGGYLFMVLIRGGCCYLGIKPYQINGERTHHYELDMPQDEQLLTGFINPNRSLTLLFKTTPEKCKNGFTTDEKADFRESFIQFARFLLKNGFPADFEVDSITQDLLVEADIINETTLTVGALGALSFAVK